MERINHQLKASKTEEKVDLDHALVLLKHMYHLKLENLSVKNQNKEMRALLKSNNIKVPFDDLTESEVQESKNEN